MRGYQTNLPGWPPRAAPNGSIKPLLEAQESSTKERRRRRQKDAKRCHMFLMSTYV